ncbi:MAG: hypothetical protein KGH75_00720 [Rhodospirillales bacterium]|nr:hypothetical protein [Rhodospirillales bacterium]
MTTVIGPAEGMAYILAKLQADAPLNAIATGGIYRAAAPQAAINAPPYVLINYQGGADVMGSFADRIMTGGLYQVAIYGPDTMMAASLVPAARLIDADLHRTAGTAQGGTILACYREQPIVLSEVVTGSDVYWSRVGGLYKILVS